MRRCLIIAAVLIASWSATCTFAADQAPAGELDARPRNPLVSAGSLKFLHTEAPRYPIEAISGGHFQGEVVAEIVFDKVGEFKEIRIVSATHKFLIRAVALAVSHWKIEPYLDDEGRPSEVSVKQSFQFRN